MQGSLIIHISHPYAKVQTRDIGPIHILVIRDSFVPNLEYLLPPLLALGLPQSDRWATINYELPAHIEDLISHPLLVLSLIC